MTKTERINLGLDLAHASLKAGERLTCEDIAAWCDCTERTIMNIEASALAKLRKALRKAGVGRSVLASLVPDHSSYAVRTPPVESV
jgi:hypothetical protein